MTAVATIAAPGPDGVHVPFADAAGSEPATLAPALLRGVVSHTRRAGLDGVAHHFARPIALPLLELETIDGALAQHPLASARRPAPVRYRRTDFVGDPSEPLEHTVRRIASTELGVSTPGPVLMLAKLRTWGYAFNPLAVFLLHDAAHHPAAAVLQVTSTPWAQRTTYCLTLDHSGSGRRRIAKKMHVSPFLPMDLVYDIEVRARATRISVRIGCDRAGERMFDATLALARTRPLDRRALTELMTRDALGTYGVTAAIYAHAARLLRRGARFHPHPSKQLSDGSSDDV